MHGLKSFGLALLVAILAVAPCSAQNAPDTAYGDALVRAYLANQVEQIEARWLEDVANREDWEAQRPVRKRALLDMLGLDPMPERTPLNVVVTGTVDHPEFKVEKLHFQSMPGMYVTANLYIPNDRPGPLPGVLYVCGHANVVEDGVSYGSKAAYQRHAAWYARHGYVALILDTYQLGEIEGIHHGTYREDRWWWWNRGFTPLGVETWNGMRALDYLSSRPEVDGERLAVTGRSGGGIYSWTIAAADDRIKTSVPTAGITDLRNYVIDDVVTGHCDCMFWVNDRRWNFAMLPALIAPRPLLLANGDVDPIFPLDGVTRVFERTRQIYALHDELDHLDRLIVEAAHDDTPPLQQGTYRWMHEHLRGDVLTVDDPAEALFEPQQLKVFDELPDDQINTRIDEVFVAAAPEPAVPVSRAAWLELWNGWMEALREHTFAGWPSEAGSALASMSASPGATPAGRLTSGDVSLRAIDFESETNMPLRLWVLTHADVPEPETVMVSVADAASWQSWLVIVHAVAGTRELAEAMIGPGAGATTWPQASLELSASALSDLAGRLLSERTALAVVAPRGVGPTTWTESARGYGIRRSHMLIGQTIEGMQVWDVRRATQVVASLFDDAEVALEGHGATAGVALYAALFEPEIHALHLYDMPSSHREGPILLNVRKVFDLPQALGAALETVETVYVSRDAPVWVTELAATGHAPGELRGADGPAWLMP